MNRTLSAAKLVSPRLAASHSPIVRANSPFTTQSSPNIHARVFPLAPTMPDLELDEVSLESSPISSTNILHDMMVNAKNTSLTAPRDSILMKLNHMESELMEITPTTQANLHAIPVVNSIVDVEMQLQQQQAIDTAVENEADVEMWKLAALYETETLDSAYLAEYHAKRNDGVVPSQECSKASVQPHSLHTEYDLNSYDNDLLPHSKLQK